MACWPALRNGLLLALALLAMSPPAHPACAQEPSPPLVPSPPARPARAQEPVPPLVLRPGPWLVSGGLSVGGAFPLGARSGLVRGRDEFLPALDVSLLVVAGRSPLWALGARVDFGWGALDADAWERQSGASLGFAYLLSLSPSARLALLDMPKLMLALTADASWLRMATASGESEHPRLGYHGLGAGLGVQLGLGKLLVELRYLRVGWYRFHSQLDGAELRQWNLMWSDRVFVTLGAYFDAFRQRR